MIDKQILKIDGMKSLMMRLVGISFLQALFILFQCIFLSKVITNLFHGRELADQIVYVLLFVIFFILRHCMHTLSEKISSSFSYEVSSNMRRELMEKIYRLGPCLVHKEGTGTLTVTAMEGISNVENYISIISIKIIEMMVIPVVLIISIFLQDIISGIILVLVFPIVIVFMALFGNAAKAKADRQYSRYKLLSNHFVDSLQGLETLKILGRSETHSKNVYNVSEGYRRATMSTLKIAVLSTFALDFFTTLSIAIVAVFLGLRLLEGGILLFPAMTVLILAPEFFFPLRQFAEDYHATLDGKNAMRDISRVKEMEELVENDNLKDDFKYDDDTVFEVSNLGYSYDGNKKSIEGVSFSVEGYKRIGIIGYSGAGKSTLLNLIGGFLQGDSDSRFYLNKKELKSMTEKKWQREIIYIPQNPYIFSGSILENMRFYNPDASIDDIESVIDKVGLRGMISGMDEGINTVIGEGGRSVSGGQAQRIAIARAFLSPEKRIVLLDEPTAHLDIETEIELKKYILELSENRLLFLSTHRLHWTKDMDEIIVMEDGKIAQMGSLEKINTEDGKFVKMARKMRGDVDE